MIPPVFIMFTGTQWHILKGDQEDLPLPGFVAQNFILEMPSYCNKFEYYNFIACAVIVLSIGIAL